MQRTRAFVGPELVPLQDTLQIVEDMRHLVVVAQEVNRMGFRFHRDLFLKGQSLERLGQKGINLAAIPFFEAFPRQILRSQSSRQKDFRPPW